MIPSLPFRLKRKFIMKSWVLLGHFSSCTSINPIMEINATSISFIDSHQFSELLTENLYSTCTFHKCIQNILQFENLSEKINHFYSLCLQIMAFQNRPFLIFPPSKVSSLKPSLNVIISIRFLLTYPIPFFSLSQFLATTIYSLFLCQ